MSSIERPDRGPQVALDRLHRRADDVLAPTGQELLGRALDALVGAVDLDHADAVDLDGHAVHRVRLGAAHVELHELEREALDLLAERPHVRAAAAHDAVAPPLLGRAAAGDDQHLVGADVRVLVRPDGEGDQAKRQQHSSGDDQGDEAPCESDQHQL